MTKSEEFELKKSIHEADVLRNCLAMLKYQGLYCWRNNTGATQTRTGGFVSFGFKGSSDILGIARDGRLLAIECKRPVGGRLSLDQKNFLEAINCYGGVGIVVTSDVDMVKQLKERGVL